MNDNPDWLSWAQAAELVGCPVPTIETYVRSGRIERRPRLGERPSLRRTSVEEFATWWRTEQTRRAERRAAKETRRIRPPEPEGWMQAAEAARVLKYAQSSQVVYLIGRGRLEGRKVGVRWWVREDEVRAFAAERPKWVSWLRAAQMVGCSHETIRRAVKAGQIEHRGVHRTQPSLSRASVEAFARVWSEHRPGSECDEPMGETALASTAQ